MKIVFPDKIDLSSEHKELIKNLGDVTMYDDLPESEEEIVSILHLASGS